MNKTLILLFSLLALASCGKKQAQDNAEAPASRNLVLYYSQTHATQQVAQLLSDKLGADLDSIVPVQAYDGDFGATIARCQQEMADGVVPEVRELTRCVADYDTIFLGYPVWFGTYAMPVGGLLRQVDLSGKVIVPFCTFGSGGLNTSSADLKAALPSATILSGYGVRNARISAASAEVEAFLISLGKLAGEVEVLPDFSAQQALTDADKVIFDAACGSYSMPLGTPVSVASRTVSAGVEYLFITESQNAAGTAAQSQIHVIAPSAGAPYFTEVVR